MKYLDCHNHTAEWSDGRQSIEEVLDCAKMQGVQVGLSDHAGTGEYLNSNDRLLAYADFLSQYPVARGLEMDLGQSFALTSQTRNKFDYMIGSMHSMEVNGVRLSFSHLIAWTKGEKPTYNPMEQIKDLELFFRIHLEIIANEFGQQKYDILGHPTMLPPLALGKPEEVFPEWWEKKLIDLLLKNGTALEISNRWKTPYDRLTKRALEAGLKFSVGSDGHDPKKTCVLDYPKEIIAKFDIPDERIFSLPRKIEMS